MGSCVEFPTFTKTLVSASQSLVTTFTESISTGPGFVSTVFIDTCVVVDSSFGCVPTVSTSFTTFPGGITTVYLPATWTVDVPVTVFSTLSGSWCPSSSFTPPIPTPTPFSLTSTDTSSTTSTLISVVTPPPTVVIPNSYVTSTTSSQSPTTPQGLSTQSPSNKKNNIAVGPVVGGAVGGLVVLVLLGFLTWRLVKRQSKFGLFFNKRDEDLDDNHHGRHRKGPLSEKPSYLYGVVGQSTSNPVSQGPLHPPPSVQNAFGNSSGIGQAQGLPQSSAGRAVLGNGGGLGQVGGLGQASGPSGALGTNGGVGQTGHGVLIGNLPSIAHTGDPSIILPVTGITTTAAASGLRAAAASSSSSRPSTGSSSVVGPPVSPAKSHGGYLPTQQSWNGQAQAGPSTSSAPNNTIRKVINKPSISESVASTSSAYSRTSWVGNSSRNFTTEDNSDDTVPPMPSMEGSSHWQQHQQHQEAPSYDGQGRPLNMRPEKAPLVHLDGAFYQEPRRVNVRSEYGPPAYIE